LKKNPAENFVLSFLDQKLQLQLHKGSPNYRRSLQPSKENIQHFRERNLFTVFYFSGSFLPSSTTTLGGEVIEAA
jgi:hypothetical protein